MSEGVQGCAKVSLAGARLEAWKSPRSPRPGSAGSRRDVFLPCRGACRPLALPGQRGCWLCEVCCIARGTLDALGALYCQNASRGEAYIPFFKKKKKLLMCCCRFGLVFFFLLFSNFFFFLQAALPASQRQILTRQLRGQHLAFSLPKLAGSVRSCPRCFPPAEDGG